MSEFIWTDELVAEFTTWSLNQSPTMQGRYADISQFKEKKSRKPLFKTADAVDMYDGWHYYKVSDDFSICVRQTEKKFNYTEQTTKTAFSTKEAAEEYVLMNKPCLSANDVTNMMYNLSRENFNDEIKELAKSKL